MRYGILLAGVFTVGLYATQSALEAFKQHDYKRAFQYYAQEAKEGNTTAQNALSYLYFNGLGTTQNSTKGLEWLRQAATLKSARAQYDLGMFYLQGRYVTQNYHEALQWLEKASLQNHADAQYNLALMYYRGDATDQNVTKTAALLEQAAQQGHRGAIANIGRIYMQLLDFEHAAEWLEKNALNNDTEAYYLLTEIYCAQEKFAKAKQWAQKAKESGNTQVEALWQKYRLQEY